MAYNGKPKGNLTHKFTITMTEETGADIARICQRENISKTSFVRHALASYIPRYKAGKFK